MQSRFSSHLKDVVPRMVIRSSLFHLLSRSLLLPAARSRLEAIAEMLEQWRFSRSKQLHVNLGVFCVFFTLIYILFKPCAIIFILLAFLE